MKRGEVWWASMAPPMGRRPVVIVQSNAFNESRIGTVVVALITSNLALAEAPGNVRLSRGEGGVSKACVVNVSQLFAAARGCLTERLGALDASVQQRVDEGLRLVLAGGHELAAQLRASLKARRYKSDKPAEELIREDRDSR